MMQRTFTATIAFAVLSGCAALSGCATAPPVEPRRIEEIRPNPPATKITHFTIQRRDLQAALGRTNDNRIRLVPVYQNTSSHQTYEYRVFDVSSKGPYALLGIQNSDILIAADGFLVKRPEQFPAYVQLLLNEDEATVEVKRDGENRLMKYRFLPAIKPPSDPAPAKKAEPANAPPSEPAAQ